MAERITVPLTEVLDFREGPGILAKDFRDDGVPLIRLAGVKQGAHILDGCNYLDPAMVDRKWSHFRVARGDVLLSTSASLGEVAVVGDDGVGAVPYTGLIRFRPHDSRVSPRFVSLALTSRSFRLQIEAMGVGSVMKHFGPMHLRQMTVTLPSRDVQEAIADVAEALDDKIAANTRLAATADELARTLVSSDGPSTPLGELASQSRATVNPAVLDEPLVAHFSLPAFDAGAGPEIVDPVSIKSNKFVVGAPSVLVSKLNPRFPRVWNVGALPGAPALASTEFVVLQPNECSTAVLWALTSQPGFGAALEGMVAGTSGSHQRVKPAEMLATPVPDPRTFSTDLTDRIDVLVAQAEAARVESVTLLTTRDTLLPQLMSGKLPVREAAEMAGL